MNACWLLSFDLGACVSTTFLGWIAVVPWWAWGLIALIVVGIVYKLAGWLGIVALAGAAGYGAKALQDAEHGDGEPVAPPPRRKTTIFDYFNGN